MKKTVFIKLLCLCMALNMLQVNTMTAYAAPENSQEKSLNTEVLTQLTGENEVEIQYVNSGKSTASTANVSYFDPVSNQNKTASAAIPVDSNTVTMGTGWYVVNGAQVDIAERITVNGQVNLILVDDCTLTAHKGITVENGDELTIWAQSTGNHQGKLDATSEEFTAAIGGTRGKSCGTVTINGGMITATGVGNGAGIGGGSQGDGGSVAVNGGFVKAKSAGAYGIGSGWARKSGSFTVRGNAIVFAETNSSSETTFGIYDLNKLDSGIVFYNMPRLKQGGIYGNVTLMQDMEIPAGWDLKIRKDVLYIPKNVTMTVNGKVTSMNSGVIRNAGTIINPEKIECNLLNIVDDISYYDPRTDTETVLQDVNLVEKGSSLIWPAGWYVAQGQVTCRGGARINGDVNLILADGCNLRMENGIELTPGSSLTIWPQREGTGKLCATRNRQIYAAIQVNLDDNEEKLTIHGGNIKAVSRQDGAGIGGRGKFAGGTICIDGGTVIATGGSGGAGIGGGANGAGGNITISGGTIIATGGARGAGIGGGANGAGGNITISGGHVTATGDDYSTGIGGNRDVTSGTFTTTDSGTAFITTNAISDISQKNAWKGIISIDGNIYVGGNQTLSDSLTVDSNKTLTVPSGATLTNNSTITNDGSGTVDGTINGTGTITGAGTMSGLGTANDSNKMPFAVTAKSANVSDSYVKNYRKSVASLFQIPTQIVDCVKFTIQPVGTTGEGTIRGDNLNAAAPGIFVIEAAFDSPFYKGNSAEVRLTLTKQNANITAVNAEMPLPYGSVLSPEDWFSQSSGETDGSWTYTYWQNGVKLSTEPADVGTYTVKASYESESYSGNGEMKLKIIPVDPQITAPVAKTNLKYTGGELALITKGTVAGGEIQYSLSKNSGYTTAIPTAVEAETYQVWYKVIGDKNHNNVGPLSVTAGISPKDISNAEITLGTARTYNGSNQTQEIISVKIDGLDVTYTVTDNRQKNAGTYTLTVTGNGNFAGSVEKEWKIAQRDATVVPKDNQSKNYADQEPVLGYTVDLLDGDTLTGALGREPGTTVKEYAYTLGTLANSNYKLKLDSTRTFRICPKELTVTVSMADKQYNGMKDGGIASAKLNGVVDDDQVVLHNGVATFADEKVGNDIAVSFTEFTIDGTDAGNYTLIQPAGVKGNIVNLFTPLKNNQYVLSGEGWLNSNLIISAKPGFQVSTADEIDSSWNDKIVCSTEGKDSEIVFYVRNTENGAISLPVTETYQIDKTAPTGTVRISELNFWQKFVNVISFDLFFKDEVNLEIESVDSLSGVEKTEYFKSDSALTLEQVEQNDQWTELTGSRKTTIPAVDGEKFVCYVRITDKAGNATLLSTDGIEFDTVLPEISGITPDETYYTTQKATISDANLESITLNGAVQNMGQPITLAPVMTQTDYVITAADKAGNQIEIKITMKPLAAVFEPIAGLNPDNVKSSDETSVRNVMTHIDSLLAEPNFLQKSEKDSLLAEKARAEELVKQIKAVEAQIVELTKKAASFDPKTVTELEKTELELLIGDMDELLNGENLTAGQRKTLEDSKASVLDLIKAATQNTADAQDVVQTKEKITDGILEISQRTDEEKKTAAVQEYVDNILKNTGVTAEVTAKTDDTYTVRLSKGNAVDEKEIRIIFYETNIRVENGSSVVLKPEIKPGMSQNQQDALSKADEALREQGAVKESGLDKVVNIEKQENGDFSVNIGADADPIIIEKKIVAQIIRKNNLGGVSYLTAETFLQIQVTNAETRTNADQNTIVTSHLTFDIKPFVRICLVNGDFRETMLTEALGVRDELIKITVPMPEGFAVPEEYKIQIAHTKADGTKYYYDAMRSGNLITFENPHGFSAFTIQTVAKKPEENVKPDTPATGDAFCLEFWLAAGILCSSAAAILILQKRKTSCK